MTRNRRRGSEKSAATEAPAPTSPKTPAIPDLVEKSVAPAAIERALAVY